MTKNNIQKIQVMQRKMERSMLGTILRDRIPNSTIRHNTGDAVETILRMIARVTDGQNKYYNGNQEWKHTETARWSDGLGKLAGNWMLMAQD